METPVIQENINRLKGEVAEYSNGTNYFRTFYNASFNAYIVVPIIVLLFLCFIKPDFVKHDYVQENGDVSRVVSYKKIIISWVIISLILILGIFGYNYKIGNV